MVQQQQADRREAPRRIQQQRYQDRKPSPIIYNDDDCNFDDDAFQTESISYFNEGEEKDECDEMERMPTLSAFARRNTDVLELSTEGTEAKEKERQANSDTDSDSDLSSFDSDDDGDGECMFFSLSPWSH
jgi:hypothetical protein